MQRISWAGARTTGLLVVSSLIFGTASNAKAQQAGSRQSVLAQRHRLALDALRRNDLGLLSRLAHPQSGVRFSPGVFVHASDQRFSPRALLALPRRGALTWGRYDGNGAPMVLDWKSYRKAFVWTHEFHRSRPAFNRFVQRGNTSNNLRTFYRNAVFMESYVAASSPGGSDWGALWTVWRRAGSQWKLVGVAHDAWTI
jgi:hypothetical protein